MTINVASFKVAFPAFLNTPIELVQIKLDWSSARHPVRVWCDDEIREQAVFLKAAILLAREPGSRCLAMTEGGKGTAIWEEDWKELARSVAWGPRLL